MSHWAEGRLRCPQCRGALQTGNEELRCTPCGRSYPVLFGIPDLRLRGDSYLSLEQERAKAAVLAQQAASSGFDDLLRYYYAITDDVTPVQAERYMAAMHNAPETCAAVLERLEAPAAADLLDAGCGSGSMLLAAAARGMKPVGLDIALRWLVICRKRLDEAGFDVPLVCADIQQPPFGPASFDVVIGADLLEHVDDPRAALESLRQVTRYDGRAWVSGANRFTLGPHPSTRLWAVGWWPAGLRKRVLQWSRGTDPLRHSRLVSPAGVGRMAQQAGFVRLGEMPKQIAVHSLDRYPWLDRQLIRGYRWACRQPLLRRLLLWLGPAFEIHLQAR